MKCTHCGGNIGLEDIICPYCGAPNEQARKHQADMSRFEASFEETRAHVEERTSRFSRLAVPITLAVILLVLMVASAAFNGMSYEIGRSLAMREMAGHAGEYQQKIDELLVERDYMALDAYYSENSLYMLSSDQDSPLASYEMIFRACSYYSQFFEMLMQRLEPDSYAYKPERLSDTYENMADSLNRIYSISGETHFTEGCYSKERLDGVAGIQAQTQALLMTYAGFSSEEAAQAGDYSKGRLQAMFEEKFEALKQEVDQNEID